MNQVFCGSAHYLPQIGDASVQVICTSPPYFGLRAYAGDQSVEWPTVEYAPMPGLPPITIPAMRCALGLESDPFAYVGHLILCLREWHRVLRDDGLCWVNLGDSYCSTPPGTKRPGASEKSRLNGIHSEKYRSTLDAGTGAKSDTSKTPGLKTKNLMQIPQRYALAAQADGWWLRSAIVWAKGISFLPDYAGSCMPESVRDRPTQGYEMVYMLAKSERYFYDAEAVREENSTNSQTGGQYRNEWKFTQVKTIGASSVNQVGVPIPRNGRNLRNVWVINPANFKDAHFATWPPKLVEPMIKASTKPGDIVLDPFVGSGTTLMVANRLGRKAVGVDLSEMYLTDLVPKRLAEMVKLPKIKKGVDWERLPLFSH